jgi:6-pyruvoyltetrahydropterin/6-carboxytetrahydropterin synthase
MFTVSREINFCYGHRLLDYAGKCRHLHGHNGRAIIAFDASGLDSHGMVVDFSEIKQVVGRWIDENLDHRMILDRGDAAVKMLEELGEPVYLMDANPTAENIAKRIFEVAAEHGFPVVEVKLWETPHCCATYRPKPISPS